MSRRGSPSSSAPSSSTSQALAVDGKQAHWHVRGANFQAVHELLDVIVDHAQDYADMAAERSSPSGCRSTPASQTVAAKTTTPDDEGRLPAVGRDDRRRSSPASTRRS